MSFDLKQHERTAVFIDGPNFYATCRSLGYDIDYLKIRNTLDESCDLTRIYFYVPITDSEEHIPIKPLIDWLDYNGYTVVTRMNKDTTDRKRPTKMSVEIALGMVEMAKHVDHMLLFSGDSDLVSALDYVQKRGVVVSVVSTLQSIADELRRKADIFIDIKDIKENISRTQ